MQLVGLNFFAGDMAGGDCGVLSSRPGAQQFRDNVDVTVGIGERLGCTAFNALYGNRVDGVSPQEQDELGAENLALAAKAADRIGAHRAGRAGQRPQALPAAHRRRRAWQSSIDVRAGGAANVGFLADLYHLAVNGDDVDAVIAAAHRPHRPRPDRRRPGPRRARHR